MSESLIVLRTNEEIDSLIQHILNPDFQLCAYDCETTGLEQTARIVGLSVCVDETEAFYVVTKEWLFDKSIELVPCSSCNGKGTTKVESEEGGSSVIDTCCACGGKCTEEKPTFTNGRLETLPNEEKVKELLEVLKTKALITQNGTVDYQWTIANYGVDLRDSSYFDTMVAAHLINENRRVGLKELGFTEFGEDAVTEQHEMKDSVIANGGVWETKRGGEKSMYKASAKLLGRYGAKDALLTYKLCLKFSEQLEEQNLTDFFFEESMPMFKGPIYDLNCTGLRCDVEGFKKLQKDLEDECALLQSEIEKDLAPYVSKDYPNGFGKKAKQFNIGSGQMLAWLLFKKLDQDWTKLTDAGRDLAKELLGKAPYNPSGRHSFEVAITNAVDARGKPLKLEKYLSTGAAVLAKMAYKYKWVELLLRYKKAIKMLNTYAIGMQERIQYGIVRPSFLQCRTTGNRLASSNPNLQNLPRDDKRVKSLILSRVGKVFVGADFEQIEPRVFASLSGDSRLLECFASGRDFYSVIGIDVFGKHECAPFKSGKGSFGEAWPLLRQVAKEVALAATYGITAFKLTDVLNMKAPRSKADGPWQIDEVQEIINRYFEAYPAVKAFQLKYHKLAIDNGVVFNIYGRPRHIPGALMIKRLGKSTTASDLPYEYRTLLNNAVNFPCQGSAGSIINRAAIRLHSRCRLLAKTDPRWLEVKIVSQIHDELIVEAPEALREPVVGEMKDAMENAVELPGVKLIAKPKIAYNMGDLK